MRREVMTFQTANYSPALLLDVIAACEVMKYTKQTGKLL
jgi:hypothetical protein